MISQQRNNAVCLCVTLDEVDMSLKLVDIGPGWHWLSDKDRGTLSRFGIVSASDAQQPCVVLFSN